VRSICSQGQLKEVMRLAIGEHDLRVFRDSKEINWAPGKQQSGTLSFETVLLGRLLEFVGQNTDAKRFGALVAQRCSRVSSKLATISET
jgi:hypothetical protein